MKGAPGNPFAFHGPCPIEMDHDVFYTAKGEK